MLKMLKKLVVCLVIVVLTAPGMFVFAQDPTARNLSVFRVEGEDALLARGLGGRGIMPREGNRLNVGNVMTTGIDTQVYMQLDAVSIVKMDEESELAVAAAGNLLTLSVLRGSALVEVEQMAPGHVLETRIGSTVMSVRGTLFTAGIHEEGHAVITMLLGEGAVYMFDDDGVIVEMPLEAGYAFWAYEADVGDVFDVRPLDLLTMSLFELEETWSYREILLDVGTITPEMEEQLPERIEVRRSERNDRRARQAEALAAHIPNVLDLASAMIGEIVRFGPHDWRVMDVQGSRALIMTDLVVGASWYNSMETVTWETSSIRAWLNNEFLDRFSHQELAMISETTVVNNDNPWFYIYGGNDTQDMVFLLSIEEVVRFFGDSGQLANRPLGTWSISDMHDDARIAELAADSPTWWWLRSPGNFPYHAAFVSAYGHIYLNGYNVSWTQGGIRPALWIEF